VTGKAGDYSKISIDGTLLPFGKPLSVNTKGEITALRMPPLSSYSGQYMGYNITSGQLDADINFNIDKGNFDGNGDLHMRNLEVAKVDPEKEPEIDAQMKNSLESNLNMLRDKNDVVNLNIILHGDIANPQFNFQDAINQAIVKAMTFSALSFVKYALQPFGAAIAIAELVGKAGEKVTKIQLDSVQFGAAEISLDETAKQYLEKVAIILNDRPKLTLDVCGKAVENDRIALLAKREAVKQESEKKAAVPQKAGTAVEPIPDAVLQDFARERAKLVKDALVNDHGISHDRIFLCLPAIDETPDKGPSVELFLD
jgi:outer membrane protein OmpA-like peptidoglycan-associated protein